MVINIYFQTKNKRNCTVIDSVKWVSCTTAHFFKVEVFTMIFYTIYNYLLIIFVVHISCQESLSNHQTILLVNVENPGFIKSGFYIVQTFHFDK